MYIECFYELLAVRFLTIINNNNRLLWLLWLFWHYWFLDFLSTGSFKMVKIGQKLHIIIDYCQKSYSKQFIKTLYIQNLKTSTNYSIWIRFWPKQNINSKIQDPLPSLPHPQPPPSISPFLIRHRSGRLSDQKEKQVILDVTESHVESIPIVCTG